MQQFLPNGFSNWQIIAQYGPSHVIKYNTMKVLFQSANKAEATDFYNKTIQSYTQRILNIPQNVLSQFSQQDGLKYNSLNEQIPTIQNQIKKYQAQKKEYIDQLNAQLKLPKEQQNQDFISQLNITIKEIQQVQILPLRNKKTLLDNSLSQLNKKYTVISPEMRKKQQLQKQIQEIKKQLQNLSNNTNMALKNKISNELEQKTKQYTNFLNSNTITRFRQDCPYRSIYIDTITYQIWLEKIAQIDWLKSKYMLLPQTYPDPVQEQKKQVVIDQTTDKIIQKKQQPVCSWYFPMNCSAMFGLSALGNLIPSLCTVKSYLYVNDNPNNGYIYEEATEVFVNEQGKQEIRHILVPKSIQLQVSLDKGYAYVPNGFSVQLQYTGIPMCLQPTLIPGVGPEYGALLGGYYKPATLKDKKLIQRFPYQNADPNGTYFWLQTSTISLQQMSNLKNLFSGGKPLIVTFAIYVKYKIQCGFPKADDISKLTPQQIRRNGVCGLQQFFSKPIVVDRQGLSPQQQQKNTEAAINAIVNFTKQLTASIETMMNAQQKIQQITLAQDTKIDQFMQVAQQMFPQFSILPEQCRNLFCSAQRKAKGTGSIKSLGQSMLNDVKAINIMASDVGKQIAKNIQSAVSTVGNMGQLALDTLKNMYDNFKIYDACSRRFKNFVQDNLLNSVQNLIQPGGPLADMANVLSGTIKGGGNLLDPFAIIGNKFMNQLTNTLNSQLVQCVTKTAATASLALDTVIDIKQINNTQALSNIKKR